MRKYLPKLEIEKKFNFGEKNDGTVQSMHTYIQSSKFLISVMSASLNCVCLFETCRNPSDCPEISHSDPEKK